MTPVLWTHKFLSRTSVFDDLGVLECDVYDAGWLIVVEISDLGELDSLLDSDDYEDLLDQAQARR